MKSSDFLTILAIRHAHGNFENADVADVCSLVETVKNDFEYHLNNLDHWWLNQRD